MGRSQQSFSKNEREKKRRKKQQEKQERKEQRKVEKDAAGKVSFDDQIMYIDSEGNLSETPPDPDMKVEVNIEDIVLGIPPKEKDPDEHLRKGKISYFNEEKGYGFIVDTRNKESIFVHQNNASSTIKQGDLVVFETEMGPKGPNAINVSIQEKE